METNSQTSTAAQSGAVDYAAALRQYNRYGRGRLMKKFCEDEGYDYWKFCKLNDIDPGKYISFLLGKLKTSRDGDDLTGLLPCYCGL